MTYGYDNFGTVTVTDSLGHTALIRFGPWGEVLEAKDPNGALVRHSFDSNSLISQVTRPDNKSFSMAYDTNGNLAGFRNPLGQVVKTTFDPTFARLTKLVDARTNEMGYTYDDRGNLEEITYPDTTAEKFDFDSSGNIEGYTNRRLEFIDYTTNFRGQITQKVYPDGRTIDYTYDTTGNLISAHDTLTGEITMQYDARDFLTRIDYPGGYWFTFEYNNAGLRTKRTSHDGHILNYHYDAAGRLESLTNGNEDVIIRYEYDQNGRLAGEIKGNGTQTTYEYDPAGQILHMINYSPGGVVQSRFDYTYDINGKRTSMTTLDGTTSYEYDDIGQLVGVTYPDSAVWTYEYDAAGNRITVTKDGVATSHTTNNMNQYTQVGDAVYDYDSDGNMISKTDGDGTTNYEYDAENRLIRVVSASGEIWEYTYDALGNRMGVNHDGTIKRYVHDPTGLVDVAAEYNGSGELVARYTHGLGLVARSDGSGNDAFYAFDGIGHTRQMADATGAVINTYDYSPFGISLQADETVPNPFRYVGRFGVMEEENGLTFMRARYYSVDLGRFVTQDPIGISAGDVNFYRYCGNDPINRIDLDGLESGSFESGTYRFQYKKRNIGIASWWYYKEEWSCGEDRPKYPSETPADYIFRDEEGYNELQKDRNWTDWSNGFPDDYGKPSPDTWNGEPIPDDWEYPGYDTWNGEPIDPEDPSTWGPGAKGKTEVITPGDPNEKKGPPGVTEERYIVAGEQMSYTIYFENKSTASAPAQEVFIHDYLTEDLDWRIFKLGEVAFGDHIVSSMAGKESGNARVPLDDYVVDIEAKFQSDTGLVYWTLRTIDPETGDLPEDALAGFLPPEDGTGRGQGYVTFTIQAKDALSSGTEIVNHATIVFDTEAPIDTNEWSNTITDAAPAAPSVPGISDGATDVSVSATLSCEAVDFATLYDLYLWETGQAKPSTPTVSDLKTSYYDASLFLFYATTYSWQVVAKNVMGQAASPEWRFTTEAFPQYSISGRVTSVDAGVSGVAMNGLPGNPVTDANGYYTATVPYNWSGTVIPQKADYIFEPSNRAYSNVTCHQTRQGYLIGDRDNDERPDDQDAFPDDPSEWLDTDGDGIGDNADIDDDNDDMPDEWEWKYFGTMDRDGTDDFDGDGISDLDEYLNGTDPTLNNAPTIPEIFSPEDKAEVTTLQPALVIQNSTDPEGNEITYEFELYADETITTLVASQQNVSEGLQTTSWTAFDELNDNAWYYWRVRATDSSGFSKWSYGRFFVNTENDPPGSFAISSPQDGTEVDTLQPTLEVTNSVDVDHDQLIYTFEVYADSGMDMLVAAALDIEAGEQGTTKWSIDVDLDDNTPYFWRVIATDEHGAQTATPLASFLVNTLNHAPVMADIISPPIGSEVGTQELDLVVTNASDENADGLTYIFELDTVNTFDSPAKCTSGEILEETDTTSWHVSDLVDNTLYYWRAKASDGAAESAWVYGSFFVNTANDNPAIPTVKNPGHMAWVETLMPTLEVNPSLDADHDSVSYEFELYADADLSDLVAPRGISDNGAWVVPSPLTEKNRYYWRARAKDEHDVVSDWTEPVSFFAVVNEVTLDLPSDWSMVSLPIDATDKRLKAVFPNAVVVYRYEKGTGYVRVPNNEELEVGKGYWILLDEATSYTIIGQPIVSYTLPASEKEWAMIGGCTDPAKVFPDGCNVGVIYRYVQGAGYQLVPASQPLEPGEGYWILLNNTDDGAMITVETVD